MTNAEINIKITELNIQANNLRRWIDTNLIPARRFLDGKVNPHFLEGLDIALEQAEDNYIALKNEAARLGKTIAR
jgi:hypothetical protein